MPYLPSGVKKHTVAPGDKPVAKLVAVIAVKLGLRALAVASIVEPDTTLYKNVLVWLVCGAANLVARLGVQPLIS